MSPSTNKGQLVGMALLSAAAALLAGLAGAIGLFARGDGAFVTVTSPRGVAYEMATSGVYAFNSQRVVAEGVGWDAFTLLVAVPALLLAAPLVARGSVRGRLFAAGLLAYLFYQYLEYAVTWAFGPLFPLFIVIYAASLAGLVWIAVSLGREDLGSLFVAEFPRRSFVALNVVIAVLLSLMWAQRIAVGLGGDLDAASFYGETTMVVQALDLGLVVPAALLVAFLVWRRSCTGKAMAAVHVVASIAMAAAILAMLISAGMAAGSFELAPIVMFGAYATLATVIGIRIYWSAGASFSRHGATRLYAAPTASRP